MASNAKIQVRVHPKECDYRVSTVPRAPSANHSLKKLKDAAIRVENTDVIVEHSLHIQPTTTDVRFFNLGTSGERCNTVVYHIGVNQQDLGKDCTCHSRNRHISSSHFSCPRVFCRNVSRDLPNHFVECSFVSILHHRVYVCLVGTIPALLPKLKEKSFGKAPVVPTSLQVPVVLAAKERHEMVLIGDLSYKIKRKRAIHGNEVGLHFAANVNHIVCEDVSAGHHKLEPRAVPSAMIVDQPITGYGQRGHQRILFPVFWLFHHRLNFVEMDHNLFHSVDGDVVAVVVG